MQVENLQYSPRGVAPIINVSQFDVGRTFKLVVFDGSSAIRLTDGLSVRVDGIKPDGHGFSYSDNISVSNNEYTITTKEQMTVLSGDVRCELRFSKNGYDVGTVNFLLKVEPSPINENTIISDTDLPDIIALAEAQMLNAEAWAAGTKDGVPVTSDDPQFENNAKFYSEEASRNGEAWAIGQRDGEDVPDTDPAYHNNSKYYAQQSAGSASSASFSAASAASDAAKAKSWAVGPSGSGDSGTDTNNSKYWSDQSKDYVEEIAVDMGTVNNCMALIRKMVSNVYITTQDDKRLTTQDGKRLIITF